MKWLLIILFVLVLPAGFAVWWFKFRKPAATGAAPLKPAATNAPAAAAAAPVTPASTSTLGTIEEDVGAGLGIVNMGSSILDDLTS